MAPLKGNSSSDKHGSIKKRKLHSDKKEKKKKRTTEFYSEYFKELPWP